MVTIETIQKFYSTVSLDSHLMYPVSSVITSPGETMVLIFTSDPETPDACFLFFGNLTSTDIFYCIEGLKTVNPE